MKCLPFYNWLKAADDQVNGFAFLFLHLTDKMWERVTREEKERKMTLNIAFKLRQVIRDREAGYMQ